MAKRLLDALGYNGGNTASYNDETTFRKLVVWLEKNKIKQAGQDSLKALSNLGSNDWRKAFQKYIAFLGCPSTLSTNEEYLNWLAGYALQEDYRRKKDIFNKHAIQEDVKPLKNVPSVTTENPLDNFDFHSNQFMNGINKIAKLLNITPHPDPTITLKAVRHIITERFTQHALKNPEQYIVKGTPFPFQDADIGIDLGDPDLKQAAKILRMLYIQDLRDLQTRANELIVKAQNVTANPKTDTKLGKVGF